MWVLILPVLALTAWLLVVTVERIANEKKPDPDFLPGDGSTDRKPPPKPPQAEPSMPGGESVQPEIALVGTVVASHPDWSRASLSTGPERGSTRVYRIGDQLPDLSTLVAIRADRVVLDRDGGRQVLMLKERRPAPSPPADPEEKEPEPDNSMINSAGPGRYRVDRQRLLELLEKSEDLVKDARVSLSFGPDGGIQGLTLSMLNTGTLFEKIDLRDGDLIHRIGSLILDHPEKIEQLPDLIRNVRELDVELTRDGEMQTLRYFLD